MTSVEAPRARHGFNNTVLPCVLHPMDCAKVVPRAKHNKRVTVDRRRGSVEPPNDPVASAAFGLNPLATAGLIGRECSCPVSKRRVFHGVLRSDSKNSNKLFVLILSVKEAGTRSEWMGD
jgi:hypothetical protein